MKIDKELSYLAYYDYRDMLVNLSSVEIKRTAAYNFNPTLGLKLTHNTNIMNYSNRLWP